MSDYWKNRDVHLKAQKKYDDKNREKKHQYDKLRWQKRKLEHQALLDIEELLLNEEQPIQPGYIRYDILEIIKKVLGDKEDE